MAELVLRGPSLMAKQTIFSLIIVIMGRAVAMGHCLNFN